MVAGFLIGFLGSLHCVGMCGPLAIVIHQQSHARGNHPGLALVLYHAGRITTYVSLGVLVGLLSSAMWGSLQFYLSIFAGTILILSAMQFIPWEKHIWNLPGFKQLGQLIPKLYARLIKVPGLAAPLLGGLANGLLPCGLVYMGLAAALATGDGLLSASMMLAFGLGTIPALLATQLLGWKSRVKLGAVRKVILPTFLILTGVFLILRAFAVPIPSDLRLLLEMTSIPMCHD